MKKFTEVNKLGSKKELMLVFYFSSAVVVYALNSLNLFKLA